MLPKSTVNDLFDDQGFLIDSELWNRDLALSIAAELGIEEMTEAHWSIIDRIRNNYLDVGKLPWMSHMCRDLGLDNHCFQDLFGGPLEAWKIAGLPNPGEEARVYMDNEEPD